MCSDAGAIAINFELSNQFPKSPASKCMLNVNNENIRKWCEICSNLTIKTPKRHQWRPSSVSVVSFEHIPHLFRAFLFLTLNRWKFPLIWLFFATQQNISRDCTIEHYNKHLILLRPTIQILSACVRYFFIIFLFLTIW